MNNYKPEEWQCQFSDGTTKLVSEMTQEELQQALCKAMHFLESIDNMTSRLAGTMGNWRAGV